MPTNQLGPTLGNRAGDVDARAAQADHGELIASGFLASDETDAAQACRAGVKDHARGQRLCRVGEVRQVNVGPRNRSGLVPAIEVLVRSTVAPIRSRGRRPRRRPAIEALLPDPEIRDADAGCPSPQRAADQVSVGVSPSLGLVEGGREAGECSRISEGGLTGGDGGGTCEVASLRRHA